ncbi:MAG: hypothetical protein JWM44_931, partial [Bacilli bacterium]|nr:hypothetical protein [Bacilli bacterium]
ISAFHANSSVLGDSEILPGKVIVKYKNIRSISNSSSIQSISPKIFTLSFANEISVTDKINELQKDPNVEYVEPVYKVHFADTPEPKSITEAIYTSLDNTYMQNWGKTVTGITYIYTNGLTNVTNNSQVVVAVIDSGVDLYHPDLASAIVPGYDFVHNTNLAVDDNGHGTNVAGIIAAKSHDGNGVNATGYTGVAPGTKIMPIKVMDNLGQGDTSTIVQGIQLAISTRTNSNYPVNIINLSIGSSLPSKAMHDVIKDAVAAGILVVAAAGNGSNHWINGETGDYDNLIDTNRYAHDTSYPAGFDEVISVGAVEQLDNGNLTIADFSNINKVDVVAPGVKIYSTFNSYYNGKKYKEISGTSQATPFVVGLAAMLKGYNNNLTADDLRSIIRSSANGPVAPTGHQNQYDPSVDPNGIVTDEALYGNGLINAQAAFQLPRLVVTNVQGNITQQPHTVTFDVYAKDLQGNVLPLQNNVVLKLFWWLDETSLRSSDRIQNSPLSTPLSNGYARMSVTVPTNDPFDIYHYYVYADWAIPSAALQVKSNYIDFIHRPQPPTVSLAGGTYSGNQSVSLSTNISGAQIYYYLLGLGNHFAAGQYSSPILLTENSLLSVVTMKNEVVSNEMEYLYTINPTQPTLPNPGLVPPPGFVPPPSGLLIPEPTPVSTPTPKPSEPVITKDKNGKSNLEVKPDKDDLLNLINTSSGEVIVDAQSSQKINNVTVELDGDVILKAKEKGKPIVIQSNDLQIHLKADTLDLKDSNANVKFSASPSQDQTTPNHIQSLSTIYDFNLSINNEDIHTFNKPIEVHFSIDPSKVHNQNNLGVYYFNDAKQLWEYVGGTLNKDNTVTALLPHFSKYAVLENNKTFDDIQSHWAKAEIEEMADKQIINGMTAQTFQPETNITRAQFVSLLSRSLKLEDTTANGIFGDIQTDAWYKNDVYAAYQARIVSGISPNAFAPEDKITREQMATLLVNAYLKSTGKRITDMMTTQEVKYKDEGTVSSWARENVRIATSLGLMTGDKTGAFNPSDSATRAEAAVVLKRFLNKIQ